MHTHCFSLQRPDSEEMKLIKKQLEKQPDVPLDKPEQFLYDLELIPYVGDRIFCFIFQSTFQVIAYLQVTHFVYM